jgi:GntR family transcriptional regulator
MGRPVLRTEEFVETNVSARFSVDPRNGVPLYLQLIEQIKRAVALGTLASGEQLPTVKALAVDLTINPNTVARAYRELERDRVIETSPGRGSFVRAGGAATEAQQAGVDVAAGVLSEAVRESRALGIDAPGQRALFERALARWFPSEERDST